MVERRIEGRIADIWGARTPFAPGDEWAVRVDSLLEPGVDETQVSWVPSACVLCSNGCGLDIAVHDGRIVGVRGRASDRVNHGRLGPKGLHGWKANNAPDRLTMPLVRRAGQLEPASWEEAMDLVVARSRRVLDEHGPLGLGFYNSGQLSWRSTTPLRSWCAAASALRISTATHVSAPRPPLLL